jgi:uncharacterized protein
MNSIDLLANREISMRNPFLPTFEDLPSTLPIFPLKGALVMPGAQLPLNIFEPRYLNMVQDALATHHLIGMVQPDERSAAPAHSVHVTGGAGRITYYHETSDGRIEIILTGVCRFDITRELASIRGYRLAEPDWRRFHADYELPAYGDLPERRRFMDALDDYLLSKELEIDTTAIQRMPFPLLVNVLCTLLPLHHHDKQAIIEAVEFSDRYRLLSRTIGMAESDVPRHLRH